MSEKRRGREGEWMGESEREGEGGRVDGREGGGREIERDIVRERKIGINKGKIETVTEKSLSIYTHVLYNTLLNYMHTQTQYDIILAATLLINY